MGNELPKTQSAVKNLKLAEMLRATRQLASECALVVGAQRSDGQQRRKKDLPSVSRRRGSRHFAETRAPKI